MRLPVYDASRVKQGNMARLAVAAETSPQTKNPAEIWQGFVIGSYE
jgi:hypothetical protein